jgi:hypothetical protein
VIPEPSPRRRRSAVRALRAYPAGAFIWFSTLKFVGLVQKSISGRASKQASILHTPPNSPSHTPFLEALRSPSKCGPHHSLSSLTPVPDAIQRGLAMRRGAAPTGGAARPRRGVGVSRPCRSTPRRAVLSDPPSNAGSEPPVG